MILRPWRSFSGFAVALLSACGSDTEPARSGVELALCWGAGAEPCETLLESPAPTDDAAAVCGELPLPPIARVPRVGDTLPINLRFAAPRLDSPATLVLTASGSLAILDGSDRVERLAVDVPARADTVILRSVEVVTFGPGRVELSGAGKGTALTADITAPLAIGVQPPRFRRLQKLAAQVEIGVCTSLPEGPFQIGSQPAGLAASTSVFGPATGDTCPDGYRGYASILWTGEELTFDVDITQRGHTVRCSLAAPGAVGAIEVALVTEPEWIHAERGWTSTVQVRVTGIAADQTEVPLSGVAVTVTGPEEATIRGANPTDVDGIFSFLIDAPSGGPLQLTLFVEGRFRRLLRLARPNPSQGDAGAP